MSKFSPEIAVSICEYLCGHSVVVDACRAHSISNSTFWEWVAKSRRDELPPITWLEMEAPFWQHIQNAKRIFANHMLDTMTERARHGSERRLTYQGREMFRVRTDIPPDPALDADPDLMDLLYGCRDRYMRDDQGRLVHLVEKIEPPVQLQLAVAAANFEAFQPHSSQSIEVINRGEMGVKQVGGPPKPERVQLEHKPEPVEGEQVSVTVADAPEPQEIEQAPEPVEAEDFSSGAEMPVDPIPDRTPAYTPATLSSKIPMGTVEIFKPEAPDDPPEVIGADANAAPADPPPAVKAPRPDVMLHVSVRAAMLKLHKGERASGAVEQQIMNALKLDLTPEQRERRLRELVGDYHNAEDQSEGLGAGPRPAGPMRVV